MATNTGYDWGSWSYVLYNTGSNVNAIAVNDDASLTSDAIDADILAEKAIGLRLYEDNTGAINGNVTITILGEVADGVFEEGAGLANAQVGSPIYKFQVLPVQNYTVPVRIPISMKELHKFKIHILNECGQQLAVTMYQESSSVPAAVA